MKKSKLQKGITLIALIITIVVLLIIAVVGIGAVKDSGIISHTQNAATDYNGAKADEESAISGYETLIEESIGGGSGIGKAEVGTIVQKNSTINGEEYSSSNPVIPAGFMAINVITEGHESYWDATNGPEVSEGLVISDGTNEFVWIPISSIDSFARLQTEDSTDYRGVLYDWDTDSTGNTEYTWSLSSTSYREPSNLSTTLDSTSKMSIWTETLYQESFNKMVASVSKYGGFYVGRYETSLNGNVAQSKSGVSPMNKINWYKMYENSLTYSNNNTNLGVTSEMIWGCQWDAMLKFILTGNEADHVTVKDNVSHDLSSFYYTGGTNYIESIKYDDIASNIYDLEGNVCEWTQEADDTNLRVDRGGRYNGGSKPSTRFSFNPPRSFDSRGSRLSLYVDI